MPFEVPPLRAFRLVAGRSSLLLSFRTASSPQYVCTIASMVAPCDNPMLSGPLRVRLSAA